MSVTVIQADVADHCLSRLKAQDLFGVEHARTQLNPEEDIHYHRLKSLFINGISFVPQTRALVGSSIGFPYDDVHDLKMAR